jgi:hypothetical protein
MTSTAPEPDTPTRLPAEWERRDDHAREQMLRLVYDKLRRIAAAVVEVRRRQRDVPE